MSDHSHSSVARHSGPVPENASPEYEHTFHHYRGNEIPWYVRLIWVGFWIFTVYYIIRWFFPAMRIEMILPP